MRAFGYHRFDLVTCKYGCCGTKYDKHRDGAKRYRRARRKTARQTAKAQFRCIDA